MLFSRCPGSVQFMTANKQQKKYKTKGVTKNKGFSTNEQEKGKLQSTFPQVKGLLGSRALLSGPKLGLTLAS